MPVPFKPENQSTLSPYLCVKNAAQAIEFYTEVFGAKERSRMMRGPKVGHAELEFGESTLMLADEFPEMGFTAPTGDTPRSVNLVVYVADADKAVEKAAARGAKVLRPLENQFYGDRSGQIQDPFGHIWHVSTHVEEVSADELKRRMESHAKV